ncbi:hypothetical protein EJ04DRAFT_169006 [Polyplosphaeria fusca]|uniref:Uncharacterized protein n=1 Tax=Polyplosphaeria fusca TaxID=682080 RepID=A0A9P4V8R3_9PLEO|nr:hypothetical protein EJ04DRAFT_169006 [Polyplosphaeria fusca]
MMNNCGGIGRGVVWIDAQIGVVDCGCTGPSVRLAHIQRRHLSLPQYRALVGGEGTSTCSWRSEQDKRSGPDVLYKERFGHVNGFENLKSRPAKFKLRTFVGLPTTTKELHQYERTTINRALQSYGHSIRFGSPDILLRIELSRDMKKIQICLSRSKFASRMQQTPHCGLSYWHSPNDQKAQVTYLKFQWV